MLWRRLLMSLPLPADDRLDPMDMHQAIDPLFIERGQALVPAQPIDGHRDSTVSVRAVRLIIE